MKELWLRTRRGDAYPWQATPGECQLHRQTKILERYADLTECRHDRAGRRQKEEFSLIGRTVLQQGRSRIAACIDLDGVHRDAGGLHVVASFLLTVVDRTLRRVPAVLGI